MRIATVTKAALVVAVAMLLALPAVAGAVLSGANGRIVYISGRGYTDAQAKPYLRVAAGSIGAGLNEGPMTLNTGQHRHPTWSPDRTMIAFARGPSGCAPDCDIYVLDLTAAFPFPQNVTNSPTVNEDRPAWSPDGTRLAYESEVTDGSGQMDILVNPFGEGATINLTNSAGTIESKPAWTPDSETIYYAYNNNADIYKEPADNSQGTGTPVLNSGTGEFQPSLSPDGTKMCYTRGAFDNTADVYVVNSDGSGAPGIDLSDNGVTGDYNCTWSPTGRQIAYVTGTFSTGDLFIEESDDSTFPFGLEQVPGAFDGNPDWAPDGRPTCDDLTVEAGFGEPVTISLSCRDTGPFYERTRVTEFISGEEGQPVNGTLSEIQQGEDPDPSTIVYTPPPGFSGPDTFEYGAFDEIAGFGERKTVTVNVAAPPAPPAADEDKAPVVSRVRVTPRKWRLGPRLPSASAVKVGAKIRWRLSEAASTRLTFQRAQQGRRLGRRCVKRTRSNASKPRCILFRGAGRLTVAKAKAGNNTLTFQGRINRKRRLSPGRYRVAVQARDAGGKRSRTVSSPLFRIVKGR